MHSSDLVRVRAFDWNVGFKDIMKAGGFDVIIGNPPYVRPHKLARDVKEYFCENSKPSLRNQTSILVLWNER